MPTPETLKETSSPVERLKELLPGSASNDSEEESQFESDLRALLRAEEARSDHDGCEPARKVMLEHYAALEKQRDTLKAARDAWKESRNAWKAMVMAPVPVWVEKDELITVYRLGRRNADSALDAIGKARARLKELGEIDE